MALVVHLYYILKSEEPILTNLNKTFEYTPVTFEFHDASVPPFCFEVCKVANCQLPFMFIIIFIYLKSQ